MSKEYPAILPGEGDNDYARYMRTDTLLSLQRNPEEVAHRDELLFQIVHQTTELWLKLACSEVAEAALRVADGRPAAAVRLIARGSLAIELVTGQLEMLRHLSPRDFQEFRGVLGNGSGFESPGWIGVRRRSEELGAAFDKLVESRQADLGELYRGDPDEPLHRLAEAMVEWDERVALWRVRHYKIATRIIGHGVIGTKGTPVDVLTKLIAHKFFPELWAVRTGLTLDAERSAEEAAAEAEAAGASAGPAADSSGRCPL